MEFQAREKKWKRNCDSMRAFRTPHVRFGCMHVAHCLINKKRQAKCPSLCVWRRFVCVYSLKFITNRTVPASYIRLFGESNLIKALESANDKMKDAERKKSGMSCRREDYCEGMEERYVEREKE